MSSTSPRFVSVRSPLIALSLWARSEPRAVLFRWGLLVSGGTNPLPTQLTVGEHELTRRRRARGWGHVRQRRRLDIDASGTGSCL